ncbi:MAG TPA: Amuc_1102 family pilus-like protein [Chthoniobacteraceae bacterium]|nr:Amuc_1102 family pilus-like protein [Chthoniobacteraceae bacterium]
MKILSLLVVGFAALTFSANAQVPVGPGSIKLGKIEVTAPSTPEYNITGGQNKRYKLGKWVEIEIPYETIPAEIDELTFKVTALIENKLLDGEVSYVNIAKGREHYAVMYISPKSIEKLTGGAPLSPAGIGNVWVEVARQGQSLGKASFKASAQPNVPHVTGMLLNKNVTPFAPLYYDRYEEIKPTGR